MRRRQRIKGTLLYKPQKKAIYRRTDWEEKREGRKEARKPHSCDLPTTKVVKVQHHPV
jgi:hypothetical protein